MAISFIIGENGYPVAYLKGKRRGLCYYSSCLLKDTSMKHDRPCWPLAVAKRGKISLAKRWDAWLELGIKEAEEVAPTLFYIPPV